MRTFCAIQTSAQAGFSLVELIIFSSVLVGAVFMAVPRLQTTFALQRMVFSADQRGNALRSTDVLVSDIKEAAPTSIDWSSIPPSSTTNFTDLAFSKLSSTDTVNPGIFCPTGYSYT